MYLHLHAASLSVENICHLYEKVRDYNRRHYLEF